MAGHTLTPYEVRATRKYARKKNGEEPLLLSAMGADGPVDLIEAVERRILDVKPVKSNDGDRLVRCVRVESWNEAVALVLATEISGEREIVFDGDEAARVAFVKKERDRTIYYSCCLLWRPATGTDGILLIHSPWNRGGSKGTLTRLLQRSVDAEHAKATLHVGPIVTDEAINRLLHNAPALSIAYSKQSGIRSTFGDTNQSAVAEMELIVKGARNREFRQALMRALRGTSREQLYRVRIRDNNQKGQYREEVFEEVSVDLETAGGRRRYSLKDGKVPTISINITGDVGSVYDALPDDNAESWPEGLLSGLRNVLEQKLEDVRRDLT